MKWTAVAALAALLVGCGGGDKDKPIVPSYSAGSDTWRVWTTKPNDIRFTDLPDGGVAYDLPDRADRPAGYVTREVDSREPRNEVVLRLRIEGDGIAEPVNGDNDCTGQPATMQLYFQRRGDDWLAKNGTENHRWFYGERIPLEPGDTFRAVPLDQPGWSSVFGGTDPGVFADAVRDMARVGVVHGGCGAAGHGAYTVSGNLRVTIEALTLN